MVIFSEKLFVDRLAVKVDTLDVANLLVLLYLTKKSRFMNFENNIKFSLLLDIAVILLAS